jgi:hypothetical protein
MRNWIQGLLTVVFLGGANASSLAQPLNPVLAWNALMLDAIRDQNTGPTRSTRNLSILHTAIFDAVNSIDRGHQPYLVWTNAPGEVDLMAAAAAAGREMMLALYPTFAAQTEQLFTEFLAWKSWSRTWPSARQR